MTDLDLNFIEAKALKEADKLVYDVEVARAFFMGSGTPVTSPKGSQLFAEQTAGGVMYFIRQGDMALSLGGKSLDVVHAGEIFGEMSVITGALRTATAIAKTECTLIAMETAQFQEALSRQPDFALMLMCMMLSRVRLSLSLSRLRTRGGLSGHAAMVGCTLDDKLLDDIVGVIGESALVQFPKGRGIIVEGTAGVSVYIVLQGMIAVTIQDILVETSGPGGVFGELALVDAAPRAASVAATTDCTALKINRESFLQLVKSNPLFGIELLKGFAERLHYLNTFRQ